MSLCALGGKLDVQPLALHIASQKRPDLKIFIDNENLRCMHGKTDVPQ